jgi:hypothetical protein
MFKCALIIVSVLVALFAASGCTVPLGPWGGPAYELDVGKIGSGQQAIKPKEDGLYHIDMATP